MPGSFEDIVEGFQEAVFLMHHMSVNRQLLKLKLVHLVVFEKKSNETGSIAINVVFTQYHISNATKSNQRKAEKKPDAKVPMAVLYLVAWQDTDQPSKHLNPIVVEVCQAVRS